MSLPWPAPAARLLLLPRSDYEEDHDERGGFRGRSRSAERMNRLRNDRDILCFRALAKVTKTHKAPAKGPCRPAAASCVWRRGAARRLHGRSPLCLCHCSAAWGRAKQRRFVYVTAPLLPLRLTPFLSPPRLAASFLSRFEVNLARMEHAILELRRKEDELAGEVFAAIDDTGDGLIEFWEFQVRPRG